MPKELISHDPATLQVVWQGFEATQEDVQKAFVTAERAFPLWRKLSLEERIGYLKKFQEVLEREKEKIAECISLETGKPLWDSLGEVSAMINKVPISIAAYHDRCRVREESTEQGKVVVLHKPHGIVAVFGPFNFPGHLPNGHIVPALLAGNVVIFKSSEFTPLVSEVLLKCWKEAGLPEGVLTLLQGGASVGKEIASHPLLDGLFFTGSSSVGLELRKQFATHPEKILALEMGGNNPLVIDDYENLDEVCDLIIQSAYLTSGQRCSCARRLIVMERDQLLLKRLMEKIGMVTVGDFRERPEPFMGPVIHLKSMENLLRAQEKMVANGAKALLPLRQLKPNLPFLCPGLIDVTNIKREDEECFGPLLQLIRVKNFDEAIEVANDTEYGLTAGLVSTSEERFMRFLEEVKAGCINWNTQLTKASSKAPFGGVKKSGNHHPSAYFAADYTSYPVASMRKI